jgi:hypothetical protein
VNAPLRLLDRFFVTDRVAIVSGSVNGASQSVDGGLSIAI